MRAPGDASKNAHKPTKRKILFKTLHLLQEPAFDPLLLRVEQLLSLRAPNIWRKAQPSVGSSNPTPPFSKDDLRRHPRGVTKFPSPLGPFFVATPRLTAFWHESAKEVANMTKKFPYIHENDNEVPSDSIPFSAYFFNGNAATDSAYYNT